MDHTSLEAPEDNPTSKEAGIAKLRLRCFAVSDRCLERVVRVIKMVHEGFWLGCLGPDELDAIIAEHFDQSRFYSSNGHNRSGFFEWEQKTLAQFFQAGSRVLVAGAGGGREVLALRRCGFEAQGFECSRALVDASYRIFDELGESDYVIHCPPDSVPAGPPTYDALVVGWTVYTHIPTRGRRIRFLNALRRRALAHAPLLISSRKSLLALCASAATASRDRRSHQIRPVCTFLYTRRTCRRIERLRFRGCTLRTTGRFGLRGRNCTRSLA